jgi:hypothetical protein
VKRHSNGTRLVEAAAGLERLKHLEDQLASAPKDSRQHRALSIAIRVEVDAYRKSLDIEQAAATHDPHPLLDAARGPLNFASASRKPHPAARRKIPARGRSAPRR